MTTARQHGHSASWAQGAGLAALLLASGAGAQLLTDPLRPPEHAPAAAAAGAESAPATAGYTLQATQVSRASRRAVINGRAVAEGDALDGGARVASIQHGSVQITRDEGPLTLHVTSSIRQPRAGVTKSTP
jgi:hypothetical protein